MLSVSLALLQASCRSQTCDEWNTAIGVDIGPATFANGDGKSHYEAPASTVGVLNRFDTTRAVPFYLARCPTCT